MQKYTIKPLEWKQYAEDKSNKNEFCLEAHGLLVSYAIRYRDIDGDFTESGDYVVSKWELILEINNETSSDELNIDSIEEAKLIADNHNIDEICRGLIAVD